MSLLFIPRSIQTEFLCVQQTECRRLFCGLRGGSGTGAETRGIQLYYANYVDKDVLVIADGEQIRRVIYNIVSNAIKYMDKEKGVIQIRVKDVGDFIQVEIEDNGKGIAAKDLPNIFDRFLQNRCIQEFFQGRKRDRTFDRP